MRRALWHLEFDVVAVVGKTADLGKGRRSGEGGPVEILAVFGMEGDIVHRCLAAHDFRGGHNSVNERFVSGAAAYVPVFTEPLAHFFSARVVVFEQEAVRRNYKAGRTKTALNPSVRDPCLLKGVQVPGGADAFDCNDFAEFREVFHLPGT